MRELSEIIEREAGKVEQFDATANEAHAEARAAWESSKRDPSPASSRHPSAYLSAGAGRDWCDRKGAPHHPDDASYPALVQVDSCTTRVVN